MSERIDLEQRMANGMKWWVVACIIVACDFGGVWGYGLQMGSAIFLSFVLLCLYMGWVMRGGAKECVQDLQEQRGELQVLHDEYARRRALLQQSDDAEKRIDNLKREIRITLHQEEFLTAQLAARAGGQI